MSDAWRVYRPPAASGGAVPEGCAAREPAPAAPGAAATDDEGHLWRRWREGRDAEARWRLVELHSPYAHRLAARAFSRRPHDGLEFGDYRQFAMVGLLESIDRYVPGGAAQFRTFATRRIQGAILNGLDHLDERLEQAAAWRRARRERAESLAPEHLDLHSGERLLTDLGEIGIGLALGFILEGGGGPHPAAAARPDDPHTRIELRQLREQLWSSVRQLPDRERGIIELHYARGTRFDDIAEQLGLSKGRVSQLHARAVQRLRELMRDTEPCDVTL